MTTWYVSGPMRGLPGWGYDRFDECAAFLTRRGDTAVSPADIDRELGVDETAAELPDWFTIEDAMRRDLSAVTECDGVVLLEGWANSVGATREVLTGVWCGLDIGRYISDVSNPRLRAMTYDQVFSSLDPSIALRGN